MKERILLLLFFMSLNLYAQVGINTLNPLHPFHVNGKANNESTKLEDLNETQISDGVVITKDGYLGVGTVNPKARIEINNGTIKIADGAGEGKVLTSNTDGVGTWQTPGLKTVTGFLPKEQTFINGNETYLKAYITLPHGDWIIYIGLIIGNANKSNKSYATRFLLSNSKNNFYLVATEEQATAAGYKFIGSNAILSQKSNGNEGFANYGMYSTGIIRVNITSPEDKTLYLWDILSKNYGNNSYVSLDRIPDGSNKDQNPSLFVNDSEENYMFAISAE